jgi:hypothetical protein
MVTKFTASQSVEISVPEYSLPIQHYLRQPQRLVHALSDHSRIEQISAEVFRLKMRPLTFISLSFQPTVDMRVWAGSNGTIFLRSLNCEILGFEYVNQRFSLNLKGYLSPYSIDRGTRLEGNVDLEILVDIPYPLLLTPEPILIATGNSLLKSVLLTIKQRLLRHLLVDYHQWIISQTVAQNIEINSAELPILNLARTKG